jgi:peptidoglycan/xylan/chitin deacetylase (PgdA/CDA1 family)
MNSDKVLNVCFHGVGEPARDLEPGEDAYWVSTAAFHDILDELATWPRIRLSFDDGNTSDARIALPALLQRSLSADFFPVAGRIDKPGSLTADEIHELRRQGMQIGSHGMWHRSWRGLTPAEAEEELVAAREMIAEAAQAEVDSAACPLGAYDRTVLANLRRCGFRRVFTSDRRPARSEAWLQPRYSVRRADTPQTLRTRVLAGEALAARVRGTAAAAVKRWR